MSLPAPPAPPALYEISGAIHCHSTYSDGSDSLAEIAVAANRAGLDFLLLTDHDTLAPLHDHGERRWGRTLMLIGAEITPRHNHYLVHGVTDLPSPDLPPQDYIDRVRAQGGFGIIAHPWERGSPLLRLKEYCWTDWSVDGFDALELWNFSSAWVSDCASLPRLARALLDWRGAVGDPDPRTLARWDELGARRRVVGLGGVDAHGVKQSLGLWTWHVHPYHRIFRTVRTHLLLPEPPAAGDNALRGQVMAALRAGRGYVANWLRGDPAGFRFLARAGDRWLTMGDEHVHPGPVGAVRFFAHPPDRGGRGRRSGGVTVRLLKDGAVVATATAATGEAAMGAAGTGGDAAIRAVDQGPGVYRVEVYRGGRGWVYSNPIYLR